MLSVHRKKVQARFQGEKLRGVGVGVYTSPELLMRELTSGPIIRKGGWVGELRRGPTQSPASSAKTAGTVANYPGENRGPKAPMVILEEMKLDSGVVPW